MKIENDKNLQNTSNNLTSEEINSCLSLKSARNSSDSISGETSGSTNDQVYDQSNSFENKNIQISSSNTDVKNSEEEKSDGDFVIPEVTNEQDYQITVDDNEEYGILGWGSLK